jgi:hypothetical protein
MFFYFFLIYLFTALCAKGQGKFTGVRDRFEDAQPEEEMLLYLIYMEHDHFI